MSETIFSKVINKQIPADIVYEGKRKGILPHKGKNEPKGNKGKCRYNVSAIIPHGLPDRGYTRTNAMQEFLGLLSPTPFARGRNDFEASSSASTR